MNDGPDAPVPSPFIAPASDPRIDQAMLVLYASVSESIGWATAALLEQDTVMAARLVADDRAIDARCVELTGLIKDRLAGMPPSPEQLEYLIAVLQMIPELERSADLAEHVAQRALAGLGGQISPRARGLVQSLCDSGLRMWSLAARAYAERSRDLLFELADLDDEMDDLSARLAKEGALESVAPEVAAEMALVARFYERIGDHAVNLARRSAAMAAPRRLVPLRHQHRPPPGATAPGPAGARWGARSLVERLRPRRVTPTDDHFYELFQQSAVLARLCGDELAQAASQPEGIEEHYHQVRQIERRSDATTVEMRRRLDATSVAPSDREDIHTLAEALDDVVDSMYAATATIYQMKLDRVLPELVQQAELVGSMGRELEELVACLRSREGARMRIERIESYEREGDALLRRAMGRLFGGEFEALEVLRWKDILQSMEDTMNRIEDAADAVETILVKVA